MNQFKKWRTAVSAIFLVLGLGVITHAVASSLHVTTANNTSKTWNAKECVDSSCKSFVLASTPVTKLIPQPSSGTATLSGFFTDVSSGTIPVSCSRNYTVGTTTTAFVSVNQSSNTFNCSISIP